MSSPTVPHPWHPPHATTAVANPIVSAIVGITPNQERPDFLVPLDIKREPKSHETYHPAVTCTGVPFLYDPNTGDKNRLGTLIRKAMVRDIGFRKSNFPLFRPIETERLKIKISIKYYVSTSKDVDNMCKFLFDSMQRVMYDNDKSIYKVTAEKIDVTHGQGKTVLFLTYCAL